MGWHKTATLTDTGGKLVFVDFTPWLSRQFVFKSVISFFSYSTQNQTRHVVRRFLQTQPVQSLSCQGTLIDRCLIGSCLAPSDKEAMITPFNFGCVFYFYVPLTSLCTLSCFLWLSPKTSVDLLDEVRWSILIENQCQKKGGLLLTLTKTVLYFPYLFLVFLLYFLSLETLRIILLTVLYALILNWSLISTLSLILIPCGCRIEAL